VLPALSSLSEADLRAWLAEHGQPPYRERQVRSWPARGGAGFDEMRDLPAPLRAQLAGAFRLSSLEEIARSEIAADQTTKYLYRLDGGYTVEAVIMRYARRSTLCISSQVGCPIGCPFCATGQGRFGRNLAAHEIVDQALDANRRLLAEGRRLSHVVFMGMGEPLANYDAVVTAMEILTAEWGYAISPRRITVSTVGLAPLIPRFIAETRVNLAVSLTATTDELRARLMPVGRRWPLSALLDACREVPLPRRKRITFEYVMLDGVNDADEDARRLVRLLHGLRAKVNLIPFNPFPGSGFAPSPRARLARFQAILREHGLGATVRESRGRDIQAACGQLAAARPAA